MIRTVSVPELVDGLLLAEDDITVLVIAAAQREGVLRELLEELAFWLEDGDGVLHQVSWSGEPGSVLAEIRSGSPQDVLVLSGLEFQDIAALRVLDVARSRLIDAPMLIIVTTESGAVALKNAAPNLWSWVGPRCFRVAADNQEHQREERLASLREGLGLEDAEVIDLVESGRLPPEPVFAEWLVLLGRGELVGE